MENILIQESDFLSLSPRVRELLPARLLAELEGLVLQRNVSELHLRANRRAVLSMGTDNLLLSAVLSAGEIADIASALAGGSFYAHMDELREGFLHFGDVRVGVSGKVATENGSIVGFSEIESLCFRFARRVKLDMGFLRPLLASFSEPRGILAFSPPGGGKTTFLRECARTLSSGEVPLRVVVVDTRCELGYSLESPTLNIDILSGYPKEKGIEIALRSLGAQAVVCDEIGSEEEARAILSLRDGGVPLVASAHAATIGGLLARPSIAKFHISGLFGAYIRVQKDAVPRVYRREEIP